MAPPKLHLNEHLSPRLAVQLRMHGYNVTSTLEMGMVGVDDDEQLTFAVAEQRAIVTFNHKDSHTKISPCAMSNIGPRARIIGESSFPPRRR
ncbi:MAG: DUF5615 family PIN-like protein [Blastocatellia bacterium]